jgi:hypothetical protein
MRVIFEDEKAKGSLMANMKNLATAEDKFKQQSITHDMTKKERLQNKEKLAAHWSWIIRIYILFA